MKKYQELENKIKELQEEVQRLKQEEKENQLPENFDRNMTIMFLENPSFGALDKAFLWYTAPQGELYWSDIADQLVCNKEYKVPNEAIIQLQKWMIQSFLEEYESSL